jgi:(E)-4-hydroxy-3-methylbut-2-enyl-diphosphate synthase
MPTLRLHRTTGVRVGHVQVGGGAPVVVQSMTSTDTTDVEATVTQCLALAEAGSELVRVTVNTPEAAQAVPVIAARLRAAGCTVPLIGDFHYNGHLLLTRYLDCADALDKYRINPGNVGTGARRDEQFAIICGVARDTRKPVRIGVNGGSLNQELVMRKMQENTDRDLGLTSDEIVNECMVVSALESTALAIDCGLRPDQIIISCKVSRPQHLIGVYRELARRTDQPLHLGLTEAGMGMKGLVWSRRRSASCSTKASATPSAYSLTPKPGGDGAKRSTRARRSCRPSDCAPSRRRSPPARGAGARRVRPSRNSPSGRRTTSASACPNGGPVTTASKRSRSP